MLLKHLLFAVLTACLVPAFRASGEEHTLADSDFDKPWFCHDLECPVFSDETDHEGYQVRSYKAANWVSTTIEGYNYDKAVKKGFWKLFKYIGGKNEGKHKIEMTAPVAVRVQPSDGPYCKSEFTISFYLPAAFQDSPPKPTNDAVFLEHFPAFKAYVTSYGGWNSEQKFTAAAGELYSTLDSEGKAVVKNFYYTAGYDSPFRLFDRHNEVWLLKDEKEDKVRLPAEQLSSQS